jgi:hypothetical protein
MKITIRPGLFGLLIDMSDGQGLPFALAQVCKLCSCRLDIFFIQVHAPNLTFSSPHKIFVKS